MPPLMRSNLDGAQTYLQENVAATARAKANSRRRFAAQETLPSPSAKAREDWLREVAKDENERLANIGQIRLETAGSNFSVDSSTIRTPFDTELNYAEGERGFVAKDPRFGNQSFVIGEETKDDMSVGNEFEFGDDLEGSSRGRTFSSPHEKLAADMPGGNGSLEEERTRRLFNQPQSTLESSSQKPQFNTSNFTQSRQTSIAPHKPSSVRGSSKLVSFSEAGRALILPADDEIQRLHQRILQLELREAKTVERCEQRIRAHADAESRLSQQVALLGSKVDTMSQELEHSREAEVRIRTEHAWAEERAVKLEASCAVLEARLDASARRQMAMESMIEKLEQANDSLVLASSALAPPQPLPLKDDEEEERQHLERKAQHLEDSLMDAKTLAQRLEIELTEAKDDREKAEWMKVAAEKRAEDLENSVVHFKQQCTGLQERITLLSNMIELSDKEKKDLEREKRELQEQTVDLHKRLVSQRARVEQSEANHATRKLLGLLDSAAGDLRTLLGVAESKFSSKRKVLDLDMLLGDSQTDSSSGDPQSLWMMYTDISDRASKLKEQVIADLAKQRGKENDVDQVSRRTRSALASSSTTMCSESGEGRCGVQ